MYNQQRKMMKIAAWACVVLFINAAMLLMDFTFTITAASFLSLSACMVLFIAAIPPRANRKITVTLCTLGIVVGAFGFCNMLIGVVLETKPLGILQLLMFGLLIACLVLRVMEKRSLFQARFFLVMAWSMLAYEVVLSISTMVSLGTASLLNMINLMTVMRVIAACLLLRAVIWSRRADAHPAPAVHLKNFANRRAVLAGIIGVVTITVLTICTVSPLVWYNTQGALSTPIGITNILRNMSFIWNLDVNDPSMYGIYMERMTYALIMGREYTPPSAYSSEIVMSYCGDAVGSIYTWVLVGLTILFSFKIYDERLGTDYSSASCILWMVSCNVAVPLLSQLLVSSIGLVNVYMVFFFMLVAVIVIYCVCKKRHGRLLEFPANVCQSCGKALGNEDRFCTACGIKVTEIANA